MWPNEDGIQQQGLVPVPPLPCPQSWHNAWEKQTPGTLLWHHSYHGHALWHVCDTSTGGAVLMPVQEGLGLNCQFAQANKTRAYLGREK